MPRGFTFLEGTPWKRTGRRSFRVCTGVRGPFWQRERFEMVVLRIEEERLEWRSSAPWRWDDPPPANARPVRRWRDATASDLLPIEKGPR